MDVAPGTRIERYTVVQALGSGGMATVWLARHTRLGSLHALKVLEIPSREVRERLVREGQVQGQIRHANILSVTDVLEYRECPCLLMEVVSGPALDTFLLRRTPTLDQIDVLARGILAGVGAAHVAGLVHRDLKPANVLLEPSHRSVVPKVADFGLAKVLSAPVSGHQTRSGMAMGTPAYMAPEQIRDASKVDKRADVFSLGALLFELTSGTRPFDGPDTFAIFQAVTAGRRKPLAEVAPWLPERMVSTVEAALKLDLEERPPDASALLAMWEDGTPAPEGVWTEEQLDEIRESGPRAVSGTSFEQFPSEEPSPTDHRSPTSLSDPTYFGGDAPLEPDTWADPGAASRLDHPSPEPEAWASPGAESSLDNPVAGPDSSLGDGSASLLEAKGTWDGDLLAEDVLGSVPPPQTTTAPPPPTRHVGLASAALVLAALAVGAGTYQWHITRVITAYAPALTIREGVLTAAGDFTSEPLNRPEQWKVTTQGGRLLEAHRVNQTGHPWDFNEDFAHKVAGIRQEWQDDEVVAWQQLALGGGVVQTLSLTRDGDEVTWQATDPAGHPQIYRQSFALPMRTGQAAGRLRFDEAGRLTENLWLSAALEPRPAPDGSWGERYTWGENGQVTDLMRLGEDGEPFPDSSGVVTLHHEYDDAGLLVAEHHFGLGRTPRMNANSFATRKIHRNADHFVTGWTYLDADGVPRIPTGNVSSCAHYRGERTATTLTYTCTDVDGNPTPGKHGWATRVWTYDERGYFASVEHFDVDGEPASDPWNGFREELTYDEQGRRVQKGPLFGTNGERIAYTDGHGVVRTRFDEQDRSLERTYLGLDDLPSSGPLGAAIERWSWDSCTRAKELRYFDAKGSPANNHSGYHREVRHDSEDHRTFRHSFFDARDQPTHNHQGVWGDESRFDAHLDLIEDRYLDADGNLATNRSGWARRSFRRDERGFETERAYHAPDGTLTTPSGQIYARRTSANDHRGNPVRVAHFGPDNQPVGVAPLNAPRWEQQFDSANRLVVHDLLDADGKPMPGCSRIRHRYAEDGTNTFMGCFSALDAPVVINGMSVHAYVLENSPTLQRVITIDPSGAQVADESGVAVTETYKDERGQTVEIRTLGASGELVEVDGAARKVFDYDDHERLFGLTWFDANGQPAEGSQGYARSETILNVHENPMLVRWYRADGSPGRAGDEVAWEWTFHNENGRIGRILSQDSWGQPAISKDWGSAEQRFEYDAYGNYLVRMVGDGRGNLLNDSDGIAIRRYTTDASHNITDQRYYNADDEPVLAPSGCHWLAMPHDRLGRQTERRCFDLNDQPTSAANGSHLKVLTWDEQDRKVSETHFDVSGAPIDLGPPAAPYHRKEWTYGDNGSESIKAYALDGTEVPL